MIWDKFANSVGIKKKVIHNIIKIQTIDKESVHSLPNPTVEKQMSKK